MTDLWTTLTTYSSKRVRNSTSTLKDAKSFQSWQRMMPLATDGVKITTTATERVAITVVVAVATEATAVVDTVAMTSAVAVAEETEATAVVTEMISSLSLAISPNPTKSNLTGGMTATTIPLSHTAIQLTTTEVVVVATGAAETNTNISSREIISLSLSFSETTLSHNSNTSRSQSPLQKLTSQDHSPPPFSSPICLPITRRIR